MCGWLQLSGLPVFPRGAGITTRCPMTVEIVNYNDDAVFQRHVQSRLRADGGGGAGAGGGGGGGAGAADGDISVLISVSLPTGMER